MFWYGTVGGELLSPKDLMYWREFYFQNSHAGVDENQDLECMDHYWKNIWCLLEFQEAQARTASAFRSRGYFIENLVQGPDLKEKKVLKKFSL